MALGPHRLLSVSLEGEVRVACLRHAQGGLARPGSQPAPSAVHRTPGWGEACSSHSYPAAFPSDCSLSTQDAVRGRDPHEHKVKVSAGGHADMAHGKGRMELFCKFQGERALLGGWALRTWFDTTLLWVAWRRHRNQRLGFTSASVSAWSQA